MVITSAPSTPQAPRSHTTKIRLVLSPNRKRNEKRPIIFDLVDNVPGNLVLDSLLKCASKKLRCKAKGLYTREGKPLLDSNVKAYLGSMGDGAQVIVTRKRGEIVPLSPSTSPVLKPSTPVTPTLRRRLSQQDHLKSSISPILDRWLGKAITDLISEYAKNCPVFDTSHLPLTAYVLSSPNFLAFQSVQRIAPARKKWKQKGSHKLTIFGFGLVEQTITQITFRIDSLAGDGKMSIGIADPRKYRRKKESQYGLGDCSHSWALGSDGMFRHRGKVVKLQDGTGRTPTWKPGQDIGISVNPKSGKLAFKVGRKQYHVNPRTVNIPRVLAVGVSLANTGERVTIKQWEEQQTMQYASLPPDPPELRI